MKRKRLAPTALVLLTVLVTLSTALLRSQAQPAPEAISSDPRPPDLRLFRVDRHRTIGRAAAAAPLPKNGDVSEYQVITIEPLTGYARSRAMGINSSGQVVGRFYNYNAVTEQAEDRQAFVWDSVSGAQALSTLSGETSAWGINDSGLASGYSYNLDGYRRAARWNTADDTILDLGALTNVTTLVTGDSSDAYDLNNLAQVVGLADIPNDAGDFVPFHAFLHEDATGIEDLGTLTTSWPTYQNGYSIAYDINGNSETVGIAHDSSWYFLPFIHDATDGMQALARDSTYLTGEWYAVALNDSGLIGGHVIAATNQSLPYYWPDKTSAPVRVIMPSQFPYGEIYGMNAAGQMVGIMWDSDQAGATEHAWVFDTVNGARDLNDLIDATSGWVLRFARDINDSGQIVGYGELNGEPRGFLLDPISADLVISKSDGASDSTPGTTVVYEIIASNNGPGDVSGAIVVDVFDPSRFDVASISWTCVPAPGSGSGAACPASGTGAELEAGVPVDFDSSESVVFTVSAPVLPGATGSLSNTAVILRSADPDLSNNIATDINGLRALDFGDAPDPSYPTLLASDGARHGIAAGLYLGASVDPEPDGQPTASADGDDSDGTDDEDGVSFTSALVAGAPASVEVTASASGLLSAWIDADADGHWDGPGEQILTDEPLTAGVNVVGFTPPASAAPGPTFARFRFASAGGLADSGVAENGEVEDHSAQLSRSADLALEKADAPNPGVYGKKLTYTLTVTNNGPSDATGVTLTDTLPPQVSFLAVTPGLPFCSESGGTVACDLGGLSASDATVVTIEVEVTVTEGVITNAASVSAAEPDPAPGNNTVIEDTEIRYLLVFADDFESGDTSAWTTVVP